MNFTVRFFIIGLGSCCLLWGLLHYILATVIQMIIGNYTVSLIITAGFLAWYTTRARLFVHVIDLRKHCPYRPMDYLWDIGRILTVHRKVPQIAPISNKPSLLVCHVDDFDTIQQKIEIIELARYAAQSAPNTVVYFEEFIDYVPEPATHPLTETVTVEQLTDTTVAELNTAAKTVIIKSTAFSKFLFAERLFELIFKLDPRIELRITICKDLI